MSMPLLDNVPTLLYQTAGRFRENSNTGKQQSGQI